jgi:hypothetical protein
MYCTDFICTYQIHNDDEDIQEDMYRSQLLQSFGLEEWNDDIINEETNVLYNKIKDVHQMVLVFEKIKSQEVYQFFLTFLGDDNYTLFKLLFKFELFYATHAILCYYLARGENEIVDSNILQDKINDLLRIL